MKIIVRLFIFYLLVREKEPTPADTGGTSRPGQVSVVPVNFASSV